MFTGGIQHRLPILRHGRLLIRWHIPMDTGRGILGPIHNHRRPGPNRIIHRIKR